MKINIKCPIVSSSHQRYYDEYKIEATSPISVEKQLEKANGADIELYINSNGGSVFAGSEIYTMLKEYKGKVTAKVVGLAASAATFPMIAADKVLITTLGQIMIHQASTSTYGDSTAHKSSYDMLNGTDRAIANVYRLKTGLSQEKLLDLMQKTTWMNADKAIEYKFADAIMFDTEGVVNITTESYKPKQLPENVMNMLNNLDKLQPANSLSIGVINDAAKLTKQPNHITTGKGEYFMNLQDLKNRQPDLYNAAVQEGIKKERKQLAELEVAAKATGQEQLFAEALEEGKTAGEIAIMMVENSRPVDYDAEAKLILEELVNLRIEKAKRR